MEGTFVINFEVDVWALEYSCARAMDAKEGRVGDKKMKGKELG